MHIPKLCNGVNGYRLWCMDEDLSGYMISIDVTSDEYSVSKEE